MAVKPGSVRIPDVLKIKAKLIPDRVAHDDTRRVLTIGEWDREADEVGGGLAKAGLKPGERVFLPINNDNAVEMAIATLGVMRAGGIAVPPHCAQVAAPIGLLWLAVIQPAPSRPATSSKPSSMTTACGCGFGRGAYAREGCASRDCTTGESIAVGIVGRRAGLSVML